MNWQGRTALPGAAVEAGRRVVVPWVNRAVRKPTKQTVRTLGQTITNDAGLIKCLFYCSGTSSLMVHNFGCSPTRLLLCLCIVHSVLRQDHKDNNFTTNSNPKAILRSRDVRFTKNWSPPTYICDQKQTFAFWLFRKSLDDELLSQITTTVAFDGVIMRIAGNKALAVSWTIFGITTPFLLLRIYLRCRTRNIRWFSEIAVVLAYLFYLGSNICDTEVWKRGLFQPGANYDNHWQEVWPELVHSDETLMEIMKVC